VTYGLEPVTTIERLRSFAQQAISIRGARKALKSIDLIVEDAWSPMEALLASLIMLPGEEFGYDLWPITLNPRMEVSEQLKPYAAAASRVPDIRFRGTSVGINYDGEDHFGLRRIAQAAVAAERSPGNAHLAQEVEEAIADARKRIVSDKRRDRDLETMGYVVLPVTKEDFDEQGGIDRVMGQVVEAIEREGRRDLTSQRQLLENESLAIARQLFIWSLMPGGSAANARRRLRKLMADKAQEDLGGSTVDAKRGESDTSVTAPLETPVDNAPQPLEGSDAGDGLLPEFLWTGLLDKVIAAEYLSKRLYDALTCEA